MTRLALDLDSTLAATSDVAFDLLAGSDHEYSYLDIADWTWGFREFGKAAYLNALWHAWTIRGDEIEPLEENVVGKVTRLARLTDRLDIVTAHPDHLGITEAKREWVDDLGIPYNEFRTVATTRSKADLEYDVYVDDKPALPSEIGGDQICYLYDQPYNKGVEGRYRRVTTLDEVIDQERQRNRVRVK